MVRLLALLCCLAFPAKAEEIVLGLSSDNVAITTTFDGSDILIFGAVKRNGPALTGEPLDVIITVSGPLTPLTVRHKERRMGIWINTDAVEVDAAPSFYAVATSAPLSQILTQTEDLRQRISIPRAIRSVGARVDNTADYTDALIRIRSDEGLYQVRENTIDFEEETLFRTEVSLPANLIEGNYATRIYLTRNGAVVDSYDSVIAVQKVGIERWLYNLAHEMPLAYGALSLCIAIMAGWAASAAFQGARR